MDYTIGDPPPGCTCGAWMSVLPPPPCPHHSPVGYGYEWRLVPVYPTPAPPTTRWFPTTTTTTGTITVNYPTSSDNPYA